MPLRIPYNQLPNLGALESGDIIPGLRPAFDEGSLTVGDLTSFVNPGKVYRVDMSQSGSADPVVNYEYENWIGSIVWTRSTNGIYLGTLIGAFTGYVVNSSRCYYGGTYFPYFYHISKIDDDTIQIIVTDSTFGRNDDLLVNTFIEILVYPAAP
jgi:hypothetical protein